MLSIRKLQQSNRVLRGSGKELLALASPNLPNLHANLQANLAPSRLAASSSLPSHAPSHVPSPASPPGAGAAPPSSACRHWAGAPVSGSVAGAIRDRELRV